MIFPFSFAPCNFLPFFAGFSFLHLFLARSRQRDECGSGKMGRGRGREGGQCATWRRSHSGTRRRKEDLRHCRHNFLPFTSACTKRDGRTEKERHRQHCSPPLFSSRNGTLSGMPCQGTISLSALPPKSRPASPPRFRYVPRLAQLRPLCRLSHRRRVIRDVCAGRRDFFALLPPFLSRLYKYAAWLRWIALPISPLSAAESAR